VSAAVTVPGLTAATLTATVQTRAEQTIATAATARALDIVLSVTGTTTAGTTVTIPLGFLVTGAASCVVPAAAPTPRPRPGSPRTVDPPPVAPPSP